MRKVAVIGSGAREHALVRALLRGGRGEPREVVAIPGNAGIARETRCVPSGGGAEALARATVAEKPDLAVVGPEAPLAEGLADRLAAAGVPCFGPSAAAARIESSKAFAKEVMEKASVKTAGAAVFDDPAAAKRHARGPCVVKLDGLAAGKGVVVCDDAAQAARAIDELWAAGSSSGAVRLLVEDRLEGRELSVIAVCDGERAVALPPARDHKRLLDGDRGPNTGGMGAICSPPDAGSAIVDEVLRTVIEPTLREMAARGIPFVGALYAGLMLTRGGLSVLEFNCRLGDPEAQAILIRLRSDPLPLFSAAARRDLSGVRASWDPRTAVAVVIAAAGYPGTPRAGDEIRGLDLLAREEGDDLWVLHAGTRAQDGRIVSAGGRVLTVAALGEGPEEARRRAYGAAGRIELAGAQMRRDIAGTE
ncbi:MAG: phosphoribosylamine--glycine ligase [Deltaproteobacteria bacterium]|nr:MAG: phosphoribosylamine--glycine ligase [Deltaproteobacteria bacterium]TMB34238.1 MAG: phosphoribosylamine--glycine ligase [Deltaproteobacteria bacterium]TMB39572.1 MAG: phosphoribosylamine--glycine ligase [Deltaproteobacteria bacterium]